MAAYSYNWYPYNGAASYPGYEPQQHWYGYQSPAVQCQCAQCEYALRQYWDSHPPVPQATVPQQAPRPPVPQATVSQQAPRPALKPLPIVRTSLVELNPTVNECHYKQRVGVRKDMFCKDQVVEGELFCKRCLRKPSVQIAKDLVKVMATRSVSVQQSRPGQFPPALTLPAQERVSLTVRPLDRANGLFIEPTHNIIVRRITPNDAPTAVGYLHDGCVQPLTPELRQIAIQAYLKV